MKYLVSTDSPNAQLLIKDTSVNFWKEIKFDCRMKQSYYFEKYDSPRFGPFRTFKDNDYFNKINHTLKQMEECEKKLCQDRLKELKDV